MDLLCRSHQPLRWYGAFKVVEAIFADPNRFRDGGNGRNGAGGGSEIIVATVATVAPHQDVPGTEGSLST